MGECLEVYRHRVVREQGTLRRSHEVEVAERNECNYTQVEQLLIVGDRVTISLDHEQYRLPSTKNANQTPFPKQASDSRYVRVRLLRLLVYHLLQVGIRRKSCAYLANVKLEAGQNGAQKSLCR